ncbi:MAG: hypothetical protein KBG39_06190 [Opitutaceae bacterium]|nr:hypothetical protein [Opitutaceae bacterium]
MSIARCRTVVGSLYALMRNALGLNVATSLESQELSCTVAPDRRLVVLGHEPIAGFARDHGTVANEAAMLALHTLDSTTLLAEPRFVAAGDSCLRADDPGWRWHCLRGHGTQLSDWERRPLGGALDGQTHAQSAIDSSSGWITTALAGKQDSLTISDVGEAMLALATPAAQKIPRINANGSVTLIDVPSGGGGGASRGLYSGLMSETAPTRSSTGLTTWVNQGDATVTDTSVGIQIINPTTGSDDNIRGLVRPVPATPYTLTALLELASIAGNYPAALLGWADDASTKTHLAILCGDGHSGLISPTSYKRWKYGDPQFTREGRRAWLQFADDGTTITVKWSFSGLYWYTLYSATKASSHLGAEGYNRLFFGASSGNITGVATLLSWSTD